MRCPVCGKPASPEYKPFCSRRCADVDLGRWLTEGYAVPSDDPEDAEEAARRTGRAPEDDASA